MFWKRAKPVQVDAPSTTAESPIWDGDADAPSECRVIRLMFADDDNSDWIAEAIKDVFERAQPGDRVSIDFTGGNR